MSENHQKSKCDSSEATMVCSWKASCQSGAGEKQAQRRQAVRKSKNEIRYMGYILKPTQDGVEVYRKDYHFGLFHVDTYPDMAVAKGKIEIRHHPIIEKPISHLQDKVEQIWKDECKRRKKNLVNDQVLNFVEIQRTSNKIIIKGSFVEYKLVLAHRLNPNLGLAINQVGVSGLLFLEENEKKYLVFSTRDSKTTEYPNYIELVPSGNLDISVLQNNGTINYKSKILEEFREETGLESSLINNLQSFCLVRDCINRVYDVCCLIEVATSREHVMNCFNKVSEYQKPIFVTISDLPNFTNLIYDRFETMNKNMTCC